MLQTETQNFSTFGGLPVSIGMPGKNLLVLES
jgi:hypothetical protein